MKVHAFLLLGLLAGPLLAADRLASNFIYALAPGANAGELRAISRGDAQTGVNTLSLSYADGALSVQGISSVLMQKDYAGVHDRVLSDVTGEFRRTPLAVDSKGALWLPYFDKSSASRYDGLYIEPLGLARFADGYLEHFPLVSDTLPLSDSLKLDPLLRTSAALVEDGDSWYIAAGAGGLLHWNPQADTGSRYMLSRSGSLSPYAGDSIDSTLYTPVFGAARGADASLWLASAHGLWRRLPDNSLLKSGVPELDTGRVTGVWAGGSPLQIWAETSLRQGEKTEGSLWRSLDSGRTFSSVLPHVYDSLDLGVSSVAFVSDQAWLAVQRTEGTFSGLLRVGPSGPLAWTDTLPASASADASRWVWGTDAGVLNREVYLTSVCAFPLAQGVTGLAVGTYGGGLSLSADSGRTWKAVLNQVGVKKDLAEIRLVPSVLRGQGATALVAYQLSEASEVTIEIFSYDMKKVRTLARKAQRSADPIRSSDPREDVWDGLDEAGRPVAMGTYYVKVQDDRGHVGWGKVMSLGGRP